MVQCSTSKMNKIHSQRPEEHFLPPFEQIHNSATLKMKADFSANFAKINQINPAQSN